MAKIPPPEPPYLGPAKFHGGTGNKPINRVVIHCTVSPCKEGGARLIARYFKTTVTRPSSAHYVVDPGEVVQTVYDSVVAYHAPPNEHSIGVELCDPMVGAGRWRDAAHQAMLKRAAELVAQLCLAYDVPIHRPSPAQLRAGAKGICGHADVRDAWHQTTHYDPGTDFPWAQFLRMVRKAAEEIVDPAPTPTAPKPLPVPDCEDRAVLRVGTANLEHGRNRATVRRELAELLPLADVWILNEADDYADILGTLDGWTWHAGTKHGQDKTGILERDGLGGTFALHRGSEQGWFASTGQRTAPKWIPELRVGTVRIYGIHLPPSIERGGRHLPTLPVRRWAVYKEQMTALAGLLRPRGPVIVGGDWNVDALADKGGRWFPRHQMAHLGLQRDKNVRSTHGKRVIDSLWSRDVVLTETKLGPKTGSDHRAVVCTYEVRKP